MAWLDEILQFVAHGRKPDGSLSECRLDAAGNLRVTLASEPAEHSVALLLNEEGFDEVVIATSVAETLHRLAEPEPILAVLLDTVLRDGSADEILETLVTRHPPVPTILVTGSNRGRELAASYGIAYVPKPFDLDALVAALDKTIVERLSPVPPSVRSGR